jgi:hypothetical protein
VDRAAADELIDLAFEFLCQRRVGELAAADRVVAAIDAATQPMRTARFLQRFVGPARTRLFERAKKSTLKLQVWMPEPMRDMIAAELAKPAPLPRRLVDELVASERVREGVRAMVQETVNSVFERVLQATPGGSGRGLFGVIGVGARVAGAAGRGLFGGIANEVIDSGVAVVQKRIVERLTSDDTARQLGARRRALFLKLLETDEPRAGKFLQRAPWVLLDGLAPVLIGHNLSRPEVREAVRVEVDAVLAELSTQTIGELLEEMGLRDLLRAGAREHLSPLLVAFAATPAFAAWKKSAR